MPETLNDVCSLSFAPFDLEHLLHQATLHNRRVLQRLFVLEHSAPSEARCIFNDQGGGERAKQI